MTLAPVARLAGAEFDVEFLGVDGVVRRGPLAQCWSVRFEQVAPARSFPSYRGQRNFPGWWWSSTMERHVGYESWLERDHLMLLDFDPQVAAFASPAVLAVLARRGPGPPACAGLLRPAGGWRRGRGRRAGG